MTTDESRSAEPAATPPGTPSEPRPPAPLVAAFGGAWTLVLAGYFLAGARFAHWLGDPGHVADGKSRRDPFFYYRLDTWAEGLFEVAWIVALLVAGAAVFLGFLLLSERLGSIAAASARKSIVLLAPFTATVFLALAILPLEGKPPGSGDAWMTTGAEIPWEQFLDGMVLAVFGVFLAVMLLVGVFAVGGALSELFPNGGAWLLIVAIVLALVLVILAGAGLQRGAEEIRSRTSATGAILGTFFLYSLGSALVMAIFGIERKKTGA